MIRPWLMLMLACALPSVEAAGIPVTESVAQLTQELDGLDREARDGNAAARRGGRAHRPISVQRPVSPDFRMASAISAIL